MDLNSIYSQLIMEHSRSGHNKKHLINPDITEKGHNPSCGDDITLELKLNGNIIEDASFTGVGCAISQASTSMMIDLIKGVNIEEALSLVEIFLGMIKKEVTDEEELEKLEDAVVLKNISNMPARVKCAVLAWHTLREALSGL
ncbi:Fe-S cluster assembly sulfur transfer protein SufU [Tepidimicrobium xylanilyticum]|uniref:Nitrogen fixation protein NifU n=1 Tax=Tepidimicrobium xylanilyticum TaxID=1123352 RepID=A0A1H2ZZ39_9FIRM|nr:SUF system NifU family Fe-S cluster assembly protein [Tepidimicrobium xylanilyticum]GMG96382.1 iron-sulfur cluster assembly scaffold protein NifU [Tepidimicrobium xylanilyticum]SDX21929.1 nitrogen fixation protein NifU [Tepidimicrobium xylanilyticum]